MIINKKNIEELKNLNWELDSLGGFYHVILTKKDIADNKYDDTILYSLTGLDFSTICRINEGKDIYIELIYEHNGVKEHSLTLSIYICPDHNSIGEVVFCEDYINFYSVDFLELFNASDYEEYKKEV